MKFSIYSELQSWPGKSPGQLYAEVLEQIENADRLGYEFGVGRGHGCARERRRAVLARGPFLHDPRRADRAAAVAALPGVHGRDE